MPNAGVPSLLQCICFNKTSRKTYINRKWWTETWAVVDKKTPKRRPKATHHQPLREKNCREVTLHYLLLLWNSVITLLPLGASILCKILHAASTNLQYDMLQLLVLPFSKPFLSVLFGKWRCRSSHSQMKQSWTGLRWTEGFHTAVKDSTNRISPYIAKRDRQGDTAL